MPWKSRSTAECGEHEAALRIIYNSGRDRKPRDWLYVTSPDHQITWTQSHQLRNCIQNTPRPHLIIQLIEEKKGSYRVFKKLSFTELWIWILESLLLQAREPSGLHTGVPPAILRLAVLRVPVACSRRVSSMQTHNSVKLKFFRHPVPCCKACALCSSVEQLLWVVTTRSKLLDITIACGKAPLILYFQGRLGLQIPLLVHTNTIALRAQIQYTADECERWHCLVWQSKAGLRARIDCGENSLLPGGI